MTCVVDDSTLEQSNPTNGFVIPGTRLGHEDDFLAGKGTYVRFGYIHASLAGFKTEAPSAGSSGPPVLAVTRDRNSVVIIPKIGDVVTARVTRLHPRFATVEILCVDDVPMRDQYNAIIRVQDVRATEIDKVEIYQSFRPGDIVRAEVVCSTDFFLLFLKKKKQLIFQNYFSLSIKISLGTAHSYFLSTAQNQYGVIWAKSVSGEPMVPLSWETMQCPKSGMKEHRKVARITEGGVAT